MSEIKPVLQPKDYTLAAEEVRHGDRIYLSKESRKNYALYKFRLEMAKAEDSVRKEGTISADEMEKELGLS